MKRRTMLLATAALLCLLFAVPQARAATSTETIATAQSLMDQANMLAALPLYEQLAAENPSNALFAERLALCLSAKLESLPAGEERSALVERALKEAQRARDLGDDSLLLRDILASLGREGVHAPTAEDLELQEAEKAFASGDLDGALKGYMAVAAANPQSYQARLFAGDVYFVRNDLNNATVWFQKAIDVNPDIETAYRYWADAVSKSGDDETALQYYIKAAVAEPYNQKPWAALSGWARHNGARLEPPRLPLPNVENSGVGDDGKPKVTINIDPARLDESSSSPVWMGYAIARAAWTSEQFHLAYPQESEYRHSLAEEVAALRMALVLMGDKMPKKAPRDVRDLVRLDQEDMLEAWVLINGADAGIAKDYASYRDGHRDQLVDYINRFVIRRGPR